MIFNKDFHHCGCDKVVKTVTGTTYRKRNDFILYNAGINKFHCTVMEWYLLTVVCLCLATNGSSSADPPAGHYLS